MRVWDRATRAAHPFLSEAALSEERRAIPTEFLPKCDTWVAGHPGSVLGFVSCVNTLVAALFVDPDVQNQGWGRALLDKVRDRTRPMEAEVFAANKTARLFYADYGFQEIGTRNHDPTGHALIALRLDPET
ncbi:MAG: GNAT family N-acetyltransferase [Pseudomonadota bacterium]